MSIPYMPLYVADYEADTAHLSPEEDGIYMRLLRLCWRTPGCSIPNDPDWIARRLRVDASYFSERVAPVIEEFFRVEKARLFSPRLRAEFKRVEETSRKRSNAGKKGGRPAKSLENKESDESRAKANRKQNESIYNQNQNHTPKAPDGGEPEGFAEFWGAYPKRIGGNSRKNAAKRYAAVLRAGAKPDEIMRGLAGYAAEQKRMGKIGTPYIKAAEAWLNAEMWREYAAPPPCAAPSSPSLLTDDQWRREITTWLDKGRVGWRLDRVSPSPADPGCRIPSHILAEFGLDRRAA